MAATVGSLACDGGGETPAATGSSTGATGTSTDDESAGESGAEPACAEALPSGAVPQPWAELRPFPGPIESAQIVTYGDRVWVVGGFHPSIGALDTVLQGTAVDGDYEWIEQAPLPAPVQHHTLTTVGSRAYLVGGDAATGSAVDTVWSTDLQQDTLGWTAESALPEGRTFHATVAHSDALWVIGGGTGSAGVPTSTTVYRAAIDEDGGLSPWTEAPVLPQARGWHTATVVGDEVWLLGGFVSLEPFDLRSTGFVASIDTMEWSEGPALPEARYRHAALPFGDRVWVSGGALTAGTDGSWLVGRDGAQELPALPQTRFAHAVAWHGDGVLSIGGWIQGVSGEPADTVWRAAVCD